jgi:predicted site-specific integrase-resolvase
LGLHGDTIRKYADKGIIPSIRTEGGKRLFDIDEYIRRKNGECNHSTICYCRVSSPKQKDDLERQVNYMQERYPDSEIVTDIGSGINYKRKGLNSILERALQGDKLKIVVAYKDRLARFGFELIESIVNKSGGEIVVLDRIELSPQEELTKDILQILHVFSCRINGMRKYRNQIKEDKDLSN